jgi:hypothetical protein
MRLPRWPLSVPKNTVDHWTLNEYYRNVSAGLSVRLPAHHSSSSAASLDSASAGLAYSAGSLLVRVKAAPT